MGLVGRLVWVNSYSKKQCRSLFWRMRAAMKKSMAKSRGELKFQYDPSSYALNFDDGCCKIGEKDGGEQGTANFMFTQRSTRSTTTSWVYVIWAEAS